MGLTGVFPFDEITARPGPAPHRVELAIALGGLDEAGAAARAAGAGLLVLPRRPDLPAEDSDGPLAHHRGEQAEALGLALLYGYAEACSGNRHSALQLVLADGRATANYRATHLSERALAHGWSPGSWLTMARLEPVTLGLLAGIDHLAPEVARALSGLGSEVLIAVLDPEDTAPLDLLAPLVRLRAIENGVPFCLVGPAGEVHAADGFGRPIAARSAGGIVRLTLPLDEAARAAPRRPELYRRLVVPPDA